jgi:hypothetical protein
VRVEAIFERLDRFLVADTLLRHATTYCSWISLGGGSDHNPIFLQLDRDKEKPPTPFNFNQIWLGETKFREIVRT